MNTAIHDGFFEELNSLRPRVWSEDFFAASRDHVAAALRKERLLPGDFAVLLSPQAAPALESMAVRAQRETLRHFGRTVQLFAPLYLANYCTNRCVYCGFHVGTAIARKALSPEEVEQEAKALAGTGLRRVLCLTGDAPKRTGAAYIAACVNVLSRHFPSVGIEVQALTKDEYRQVCRAGADSMTMFQETYDPDLYERLHHAGPKRDFVFRLDAPHRAALAGMRGITLGALLGLGSWRRDVFMLAMHAAWLARRFPQLELSVSLPRIRPVDGQGSATRDNEKNVPGAVSAYTPLPVGDKDFVQALTALRCFLPHIGITLSSRESAFLRDKLIPLGVTRVSAGVRTSVGGYASAREDSAGGTHPEGECLASMPAVAVPPVDAPRPFGGGADAGNPVQFVIDDTRSVAEMEAAIQAMDYQPVFADWLLPEQGTLPLAPALQAGLALRGEHSLP